MKLTYNDQNMKSTQFVDMKMVYVMREKCVQKGLIFIAFNDEDIYRDMVSVILSCFIQ